MSGAGTFFVILIIIGFLRFIGVLIYRLVFLSMIKDHREEQTKITRFLQVRIPKKSLGKGEEAGETVQTMKQNIEIMNQVYKNFYAIFESGWKYKHLGNNYISMELLVENEVIKFVIAVPETHLVTMEKMISSFYPGALVDVIPQPKLLEAGKYMAGGEFELTKHSVHPLKTYESFEADPMDSILSASSNISKDEKMLIQILAQPLHESWLKRLRKKADKIKQGKDYGWFKGFFLKLWKGKDKSDDKSKKDQEDQKHSFSQTQLQDFDKKMDDEMFLVKIRAFATSPDPQRPRKIVDDISRLFNQYNYIGLNTLKFKRAKDLRVFAREMVQRLFFSEKGTIPNLMEMKKENILNIKELSSIIHFPHAKFNKNPRIKWQGFRIVAAPDDLPSDGITVGYNTYGGVKRDIKLTAKDRLRHVYILGQTGTGKTTIMLAQMYDDLYQGNGFTFLDPHGDGIDNIMLHYPKERIDDLIYFDLSNTEYPIAFNPLDGATSEDERDVVTNDLVEMFVSMYGEEIFGPRIQDYFRNACFLLMEQPEGGTLVDIMRLFTDDAFAESKIRNLKNPIIAARWNKTYKKMGDREKAEIIPFIQAKFGPFTTGTYVRNIIGQPKSAFNFDDAMQQKKVILVKLAKGLVGEVNSQLIGRMVSMQLKLAALRRASMADKDRVVHYLYIDEFQNYVSQSIESILSEARKYKLGLTIAHQYIDQLKKEGLGGNLDLSKTIFGNVGSMFVFKVGATDAEFLEREMSPEFTQTDLVNTEAFMGACKICINGQQSRPFSFKSRIIYEAMGGPKPVNTPEKIEIMRQISALKWGTKRELVDKEIYFRVGV